MRNFLSILFITGLLFLASCKKYEEDVVTGNVAPPDETFANTTIENYINKTYISLMGREPDVAELQAGISVLKLSNVSASGRDNFLNQVLSKPGYYPHLFNMNNNDLLNNQDTSDIANRILLFQFLLTDSTYFPLWGTLQFELNRLLALQQIASQLQSGNADVIDLHRTLIDNFYYDQINMGSLNFVVSMFQNFLNRYPTVNELDAGIAMVDGSNAILFGQVGGSKQDFITIFFSSYDYYEGQVRSLYLRYLFREPTSTESTGLTLQYKSTGNYKQMQKAILSTNEFIGV